MNTWIIILATIIVVLFILYRYYFSDNSKLAKNVSLNTTTPVITGDTITNPSSSSYTYSIWVYVNSWNSNYEKPLYTITNGSKSQTSTISNLAVNPALQTFSLYLDKTSPKLKYSIATSGSSSNTVVTITDNFPIQRWCYVAISVDGTVVDAYLDGKLVLSKQLSSAPTTNINLASSAIVIGDSVAKHDTYVGLANRLEYATTPEAVWKSYLATAGSMSISSVYNLKLSLLQNNSETNSYKLW